LVATDYYSYDDSVHLYRIVEFCGTKPVEQTMPIYIDEDASLIGYYDYEFVDEITSHVESGRRNVLKWAAEIFAKEWGGEVDAIDNDVYLIRRSNDLSW